MHKRLFLILLIFFIIQIPILFTTLPADENVYYAISREVSKGHSLYSDIFFGHPPLQIYLYSAIIYLFGLHLWILKLFTLFISIGNCFMVYLISRERYNEKIALIASFIFLTSYNMLIFGSFAFGIEIAVLFFLISFYLLGKNELLSGVFFALSIMTRLHLAFLGVILLLYSKKRVKFLAGTSVSIVYYLPLLFIPSFINQVFGYHMAKPYFFGGWVSYFKANIHLLALFFFSIKKIKDVMLVFIGLTYLLFLLLLKSTFEYYFLLVTIILCIEGSVSLVHSKDRKILWFVVILWIFLILGRAIPFLYNNTNGYNDFTEFVNTLENKPLMGQSAITSMLALKTGREISNLQIDTNFQRNSIYNYSNSIVIYESGVFKGEEFGCEFIRGYVVDKIGYHIWDC